MVWKMPAVLSLLFLAAGAAPPGDCSSGAAGGQTLLPAAQDLAGRPSVAAGLSGQTFAALPSADSTAGCRGTLPSATQSTTLRSESGDVLHGLPAPEILRPMNEPKRAPEFQ
jgi:hypothetical protein